MLPTPYFLRLNQASSSDASQTMKTQPMVNQRQNRTRKMRYVSRCAGGESGNAVRVQIAEVAASQGVIANSRNRMLNRIRLF